MVLKKISILVAFLLMNVLSAEEQNSLSEALGIENVLSLSGSAQAFYQTVNERDENIDRDELGYGSLFLKGETVEWQGLQLGVTGMFSGEFHDHDNTYSRLIERNALLAEAYARYTLSKTTITLGREARDWLMLGDYFEGAFLESLDLDGFRIRAAWVEKVAVFDPDEVVDYEKLNESNGVYGTEITYQSLDNIELTGLYYNAPNAYDIFGGHLALGIPINEQINSALTIEYYETNEKRSFDDYPDGRGSIFHIGNELSINDLTLSAGYIEAGNGAGAGNMLNNPWDPFEEDSHTDRPGAETWYLGTEYALTEKLTVGAVYGESQTDDGNTADAAFREFNFLVSYSILDNLLLDMAYIHVDSSDQSEEGFEKVWFNLVYEF
jgi:hypothetical protein